METPQRPNLPGTWLQTPAGKPPAPAPSFSSSVSHDGNLSYAPGSSRPTTLNDHRTDQNPAVQQQHALADSSRSAATVDPDGRAARAVNEALEGESRFPELDSYLSRMCTPFFT